MLWSIGLTAVATGARVAPRRGRAGEGTLERRQLTRRSTALTVPALATVAALAVLVLGRWVDVPQVAVVLAAVTLLVAAVRTQLAFLQVVRLFDLGRQARTDSLTGLGNRRALLEHLGRRLDADRPRRSPCCSSTSTASRRSTTPSATTRRRAAPPGRPAARRALRDGDLWPGSAATSSRSSWPRLDGGPERGRRRGCSTLLGEPFDVDGVPLDVERQHRHRARAPTHGDDIDELLQRADVAMYAAKAPARGVARLRPARDEHSRDRLALVERAARALDRAASSSCTTSRSRRSRRRGRAASRRWCAGSTRRAGCSRPTSSSRWPSRPG